jgi:hypothetical protein
MMAAQGLPPDEVLARDISRYRSRLLRDGEPGREIPHLGCLSIKWRQGCQGLFLRPAAWSRPAALWGNVRGVVPAWREYFS